MGKWGKYFTRSKWSADGFVKQSGRFVEVRDGKLDWGYVGQHSSLLKDGVKFEDIRWLLQRLSRVTDDQLRTGLLSSGASDEQAEKYQGALRRRIAALEKVVAE